MILFDVRDEPSDLMCDECGAYDAREQEDGSSLCRTCEDELV